MIPKDVFYYQGALRLNVPVVSVKTKQEVKMEAQGERCWIHLHQGLYIGYLIYICEKQKNNSLKR